MFWKAFIACGTNCEGLRDEHALFARSMDADLRRCEDRQLVARHYGELCSLGLHPSAKEQYWQEY